VSDERLIGRIKHVSPRGFFFLTCEDAPGMFSGTRETSAPRLDLDCRKSASAIRFE
jgi:hypothetical protein